MSRNFFKIARAFVFDQWQVSERDAFDDDDADWCLS